MAISLSENTGVVFVLVFPDGERFFIDDRGANAGLRFEDIDLEMVRSSEHLYVMGYSRQDEMAWDCIEKTLAEVSRDVLVVFNPGAPNVTSQYRGCFVDIIKEHVDILVLNEAEANCLTQCDAETEMVSSLLSMADTVTLAKGNVRQSGIGGEVSVPDD